MLTFDFKDLFFVVTAISVVLAFITSTIEARKKLGTHYVNIVHRFLWNTLKTISPILVYIVICVASGNWSKFLLSETVAVVATTLFLMATHELGCGFGVKGAFQLNPSKVEILSTVSLTGLIASLVTCILIFIYGGSSSLVAVWQGVLLTASMFTYYIQGSMVTLFKRDTCRKFERPQPIAQPDKKALAVFVWVLRVKPTISHINRPFSNLPGLTAIGRLVEVANVSFVLLQLPESIFR